MTSTLDRLRPSRADIFLSYAREDIETALQLAKEIESYGHTVAMDKTVIAPGDDWQARLDEALRGSAKLVFLATPMSILSSACAKEIAAALQQGKPILPVILGRLPGDQLPVPLRRLHYTRLAQSEDWTVGIAALSDVIGADLAWERTKAGYVERASSQRPILIDRHELVAAERWALARPGSAPPIPPPVTHMIEQSRSRLAWRDRMMTSGLIFAVVVFAGLATAALLQWQRQIQATNQAEITAALRVSGPVNDLLSQGRQLDALLLLREAVETLIDTRPVDADMHIALRSALRSVAGQTRFVIPNDLVAHDFDGRLLLQDPNTGELLTIEPSGLSATGASLSGEILAWERVQTLGQGIVARNVDGTLLFNAFNPITLEVGPVLATLPLSEPRTASTLITIGVDGLALVNRYASSRDYYFESASYEDFIEGWVIDLISGDKVEIGESSVEGLWNDRSGRSYLAGYGSSPDLLFDTEAGSLTTISITREERLRDVFHTCFRHHLDDPDLELIINRMQESWADDLSNTSFTLLRPECRSSGEWLVTLTGRTSGSGFWRDIAIFDREELIDRDGSWRDEGFFDPERGAARVRYSMLQGMSLPGLSPADSYEPNFVAYDGRTMISDFLPGERRESFFGLYNVVDMQHDTQISAAALVGSNHAAWIEVAQVDGAREVILFDMEAARVDPFVELDDSPRDPQEVEDNLTGDESILLSDGNRFTTADRLALGLEGWGLTAAPGEPILVASDWNEEVWLVARNEDGHWTRTLMFIAEQPAAVMAVSRDASLALVLFAGATMGQNEMAVVSTADGSIIEYVGGGPNGDIRPDNANGFVEDRVSAGPDDLLIRYDFPDYAGYLTALDDAILRLCGMPASACRIAPGVPFP